jgi:hypothetical protein
VGKVSRYFFCEDLRNIFGATVIIEITINCLKGFESGVAQSMSLWLLIALIAWSSTIPARVVKALRFGT